MEGKVRGDKTNMTEVLLERKIKSFRKSKCKSTEILLLLQIFKKTFDILIHIDLQFSFSNSSQFFF